MPRLPSSDLRHGRNCYAPYTASAYNLVLGNLSLRYQQERHLRPPTEPHFGNMLCSAWHLLDRIRTAMGQRDADYQLSGIVEMDDGYVGGPSHNGKRGRGTSKRKIVVAISKTENSMFARMKVVEDIRGTTLQEIVNQYFLSGTTVECDGCKSYLNLQGVKLEPKKYEIGDLPWLHKAISNLKAFLLGTYHGRCTKLQSYLDEYCFRFNRRMTDDQVFLRLARAIATSCGVLS